MKKVVTFFICVLPLVFSWAQDKVNPLTGRAQLGIEANSSYKTFYGKRYIQPSAVLPTDIFEDHQFDRFTKMPVSGFSAGCILTYRLYKNWRIGTGLLVSSRKDIYENNMDTVIKYGNTSSLRDLHNALKYEYTYYNIECPVLVQFIYRKISFYTGLQMTLLSKETINYTYVIPINPSDPYSERTTAEKTFDSYRPSYVIFPFVHMSYDIRIYRFHIFPFVGIEGSPDKQKSYYLKCGLIVPLIKI